MNRGACALVLSVASLGAGAPVHAGADDPALVAATPCLFEYRMWYFTFGRSPYFSVPSEFTPEQCDRARVLHEKMEAERAAEVMSESAAQARAQEIEEAARAKEQTPEAIAAREAIKAKAEAERADRESREYEKALAQERAIERTATARRAALSKARAEQAKRPEPRIGMTRADVFYRSKWGQPNDIHRTTTANGKREQWVYGNGRYLYFDNDVLVAIQD
jgi:flagellar biosynthesis GTPase FlhF